MAQNGIILQEPIFYGPNTPNALSAEDFITRVDSYARTQNWTDQVAATHARMYLRGGPAEHFLEGLQSYCDAKGSMPYIIYSMGSLVYVPW